VTGPNWERGGMGRWSHERTSRGVGKKIDQFWKIIELRLF